MQSDGEQLRRIADKLLSLAESGDIQAMKEIGDRLDGKPSQQLDLGNAEGKAFEMIQRTIVDPRNSNT